MKPQEEINEVLRWAEKNGIKTPTHCSISIQDILDKDFNLINASSMQELEEVIYNLCSLNIYFSTLKGSLLAQLIQLDNVYTKKLKSSARKLHHKYRYNEDRESAVLDSNPELTKMFSDLTVVRMKYSKIKHLPDSINKYIDILRNIYYRKVNESKTPS